MKGFGALLTADSAFDLGRISGIRFRIHYSWFVIFVLVIYLLSQDYLPGSYPGWSRPAYVLSGTIAALALFASVVSHELAHSLVARANGMPVKSITLFIFGGVAEISREAARAGQELIMAAAGPACSLLLGGLFFLIGVATRGVSEQASAVLSWLVQTNIWLAVFNLIPGFPLDGGRIFHSLLWRFTGNYRRSIRIAIAVGRAIGYLFVLGGIVSAILLHDWIGGLWIILVGWFLASTAAASYRHIRGRENLVGVTASKVMTANYQVVPAYLSLERLMQEQKFLTENLVFVVADADRLRGMLTLQNIQNVDRGEWGVTTVKDIISAGFPVVSPEQDAMSLMEQMEETGRSQVAVVNDGVVVGVVTRDALMKLLHS